LGALARVDKEALRDFIRQPVCRALAGREQGNKSVILRCRLSSASEVVELRQVKGVQGPDQETEVIHRLKA
jgi:hypothetical protein